MNDLSRQATRLEAIGGRYDPWLSGAALALACLGVVMVASASIAIAENLGAGPFHYLGRHVLFVVIGVVLAGIAMRTELKTVEKYNQLLLLCCFILLLLPWLPGLGVSVNGARRWIGLGPVSFQPSELAKFAVLLYAANYMVRKMEVKEQFLRAVWPMAAAVAVVGLLLLAEPDMGAFMVIAVIAMGILFLGGVNARMFFLIATVTVLVSPAAVVKGTTFSITVKAEGIASVRCTNPAGNVAPGQSFETDLTGSSGPLATPRNGQFRFALTSNAPSAPAGSCPNPQWTATVTDVQFTSDATITLRENGVVSDVITAPIS